MVDIYGYFLMMFKCGDLFAIHLFSNEAKLVKIIY